MRRYRASRAFTFVEMLAVLAIAGVLLACALPAFGDAIARHRLRVSTEALLDALGRARAAAVWRNQPTTLCASADGRTCLASSDWTRGWIARPSLSGDTRQPALDDRIVLVHRDGRSSVDFKPNGTSPASNQTLVLCLRGRPASAVAIVIGNAGLARRRTARADEARTCAAAPSRKRKDA